jgi:tetratricopeptide (TPR) repeat protein
MCEVDRVGYQAGIFAAQTIIREFNSNRPSELYSLLEVKAPVQPKSQKISTSSVDQSDKLYQKGLYHFEKKNFEQALHGFQQAERQNPDDPVIKFYVGICRMYTGQRARALDNLKSIIAQNPKDNKLIGDCRSWVQRLNDPLKISIVFVGSEDSFPAVLRNSYVNALTDCGMYDIVDVRNVQDSDIHNNKSALKKCLQESSKKNARVAILVQGVSFAREVMDSGLSDGDLATEFELSTDVRAYGIRKKNAVLDCLLTDSTTRLNKLTEPEKLNLHAALAQRSSNRLVLSLLGNEIF